MKIEGPKEINPGEESEFTCSSDHSYPGFQLGWRLRGNLMEGTTSEVMETENGAKTVSHLKVTVDNSFSQANLVCFVSGMALQVQSQKMVKVSGKNCRLLH